MTDVQSHLNTIAQIDDNDRNLQRGRERAIEGLTNKVVNSIMGGHTTPASAQLLAATEGFVEAFAAALVKRHGQALYDRATLATAAEQSGCEDGAAAARILRAMNAAASPVFWINPSMTKPWDIEPAQGAIMKLPAIPGWTVEKTPDGGAKGICERGIQFFVNGQNCGGVDVQAADQLSRRITLDEVDSEPFEKPAAPTTYEATRAAHAKAKAEKSALDSSIRTGLITPGGDLHRTMLGDIVERLRSTIAETGVVCDACDYDNETREDLARVRFGEDATEGLHRELLLKLKVRLVPETEVSIISDREGTETITLVSGVDEEDEGPQYDTVSQDDIRKGDVIEYHDGDTVRRWAVLCCGKKPYGRWVQVQLLDGPIHATEVVQLPLPGDPFILRPRSS